MRFDRRQRCGGWAPHISLLGCGFAGLVLCNALHAQQNQQPQPFTLQQVLSAPYASELTAAPTGNLFAWVENAEGRHNLWVGSKDSPARQLTHNTADDGLEITNIAWSPDARTIAFTYGTPSGADGKPANPTHLQHPTAHQVILQPIAADAQPIILGEGHAPLFTHDGKGILFLRNGQVWIAGIQACAINKACHPERSLAASSQGGAEGPATLPDSPILPAAFSHQLIFDRGTASHLTLSPDGNTLAFISRRNEPGEPSHSYLALYDLQTLVLTFPAPSTGNDSAPAFSPDGQHLAWLRAPFTPTPEYTPQRTSPNPWSIQLLDFTQPITTLGFEGAGLQPRHDAAPKKVGALALEGNHRTLYSPQPNKPGSALPHLETGEPPLFWYQDATSDLLFFVSEITGHNALYLLSLKTSAIPFRFTQDASEVEDVTLSGDGLELLYTVNTEDDIDRRHIRSYILPQSEGNLGEEQETLGMGMEFRPTSLHDHAADTRGQRAALVSDARTPAHPALTDSHGAITPLRPNAAPTGYPATSLATPTQIVLPSTDNLQIHGQLFLPDHLDSKVKHPAILFLHGGPNRQMLLGYPAMEYYSNAYAFNQYLASRGFIVLSVNYRMGIGYGMDFREAANVGPNGAAEYNDVLAAAKYLQSRPDVDPKRIGLWGGSYGGYLTQLALARNSDIFAAGVSISGIFDWNLEANASDWKQGSNAEQDAIAAKARANSPIGSINTWRSPVLLIHGDNDPDVAYAQTTTAADALRAHHVPVEELIFPDELHDFLLHSTWLSTYTAAAKFFERKLMK